MKKKNIKSALLMIGLLLFCSFESAGQERKWHDSLLRLLKHDQSSKIKDFRGLDKLFAQEKLKRLAIHNINKHLKEVAKLRASGKSEVEILSHFNAIRQAVGTGSISGVVYESDGETPIQNYVSVWAFNEYGQYSGYASIYPSEDKGDYVITGLSSDKYYVRTETDGFYIDEYYDDVTDWRDATLVPVTDGKETSGINFALGLLEDKGAISGQVLSIDGVALSDCYIIAYDKDYWWVSSGSTDANGLYTLSGLPSGEYKLHIEYWGSEDYVGEWYDDAQSFETATLVPVTAPNTTENINFILNYAGAIEGRVFDSAGNPVGLYDCYIVAYDSDENWVDGSQTDESGSFALSRLRTGVYRLFHFYAGQENYLDGWYDGAEDFESATAVAVTAPDITKDVHITLKPGGAIEGRVFDSTGQPVDAWECEITAYDSQRNCTGYAYVYENGNFAFLKLKTGVYRLRYNYYGWGNYLDGWYDGAEDFGSATPVVVTAPDATKDVNITLQPGGAISGIVFDYNGQPMVFDCAVNAYDSHQNYVGTCGFVDENGNYTIGRLPTGLYKIYAEYMGYGPSVGEEPASEWYDGKYKFEDAAFVRVTAPYTTDNVDFTLKRGGCIQGRVYGPEDQLLSYSGDVVAYNLQGDPVRSHMVANEGLYFITGLPTQDYKLRFYYYGEENYKSEWYNGKQGFSTADSVHVTAPNMTPDINFTLEHPGILQGFVTDTAGNRLAEGENFLQIYAYDADSGEYIDFNSNSFVGGYQFELMGRDYKLGAVSYYANGLPEQKNLAATYYEHGTSLNDPSTQTISLEAGTTLKLNDLVMEQADGAISGTIYDECAGQPVTKGFYFVFAFDEDGYLAKASVFSEYNAPITGEYQLYGLKPGKYYVLAAVGAEYLFDFIFQWYTGIEAYIDLVTFTPKVMVPVNATAVTVAEDIVSGVDFNFRLNYKYALTITAGAGGAIDLAPGTHTFCEETDVTIEAIPDTDYGFSHWSGDIPQGYEYDNPLTITVDSDKSIKANFAQLKCELNISSDTGGTTDPSPGSYKYDTGTQVSIRAIPNSGYLFSGWTGQVPLGHENDNPVTITMDSYRSIRANFILPCILALVAGTGGTTNPEPGSHTYDYGTLVSVTALPNSGYKFSGWAGDASGTTNPINITMDADKTITATFSTITSKGTGDGDGGGKKGGCFIATAAYGSPLHHHLDILRDFRDKYLMPSKFGRTIVNIYYKYSPLVANLIAKYKVLRIIIRLHLLPFVALSYLMLHFNTEVITVILLFIFALLIILFALIKRKIEIKRGRL